jgi:hypothetical protein
MWRETQGDQGLNRFDMRVHLTDAAFISLLSAVSEESLSIALFASFQELFEQVPGASGECKMGLRMTERPTILCIAFHCDRGYAKSTPQIALVNPLTDYTGGELCFFVHDIKSTFLTAQLDPWFRILQKSHMAPLIYLLVHKRVSLLLTRSLLLTWKKRISLLRLVLPHLLFKAQEHQPGSPAMIG